MDKMQLVIIITGVVSIVGLVILELLFGKERKRRAKEYYNNHPILKIVLIILCIIGGIIEIYKIWNH